MGLFLQQVHLSLIHILNYGGVDVEARNETEAQEKARQEYYNGNVFWKDSEISDLNAEAAHRQQKDRGEAR